MILEEVTSEQYCSVIKANIIFDAAAFNELNFQKVDRIRYFLFRDGKYRFGVCVGQKGDFFLMPFSAPFACFEHIKTNWKISQLEEAVDCLEELSKREGVSKIRYVLPPFFYDESIISSLQNILIRKGYRVTYQDLNFSIRLNIIDMGKYISNLPANGRKNLKIALEKKLRIRLCNDLQDIKRSYEIIKHNRMWKGYPLRMSWEQVEKTIAVVPHEFFIVSHGIRDIAAAMVYHVTKKIAQVIYWGDIPDVASLKPMNYLAYQLVNYYNKTGVGYLDIGPSTENGSPNYGLCDFKRSIGCEIQAKFTMEKIYR